MARLDISTIKSLARSYVRWPEIDRDLEESVKDYAVCQQNALAPSENQVSWSVPEQAWG